jgi:hypothetical protein
MQTPITVRCLTEQQKDVIIQAYQAKASLKQLAFLIGKSTRTIGRVLEERGLLTPVPRLKGEAYHTMKLLEKRGIGIDALGSLLGVLAHNRVKTAIQLQGILNTPALTPENIQIYLDHCTKEQLATHFYTSGLVKLAETTKQTHDTRKQQQAALFCPPQQTSFAGFAA